MKKYVKNVLVVALVMVFVAIFNLIAFNGAEDAAAYLESRGKSIEVQATVTGSEKFTEIDEGYERDYWHVSVSYTYNGTEYNDVFYERTSKEPTLGKKVIVEINQDVPDEVLPTTFEFVLVMILTPLFLTGVTFALITVVMIIVDAVTKKENSKLSKVIAGIVISLKIIIESIVFHSNHNSMVFSVFSIIALILAVYLLRRSFKTNPKKTEIQ